MKFTKSKPSCVPLFSHSAPSFTVHRMKALWQAMLRLECKAHFSPIHRMEERIILVLGWQTASVSWKHLPFLCREIPIWGVISQGTFEQLRICHDWIFTWYRSNYRIFVQFCCVLSDHSLHNLGSVRYFSVPFLSYVHEEGEKFFFSWRSNLS